MPYFFLGFCIIIAFHIIFVLGFCMLDLLSSNFFLQEINYGILLSGVSLTYLIYHIYLFPGL
jgi:hypothetical protein